MDRNPVGDFLSFRQDFGLHHHGHLQQKSKHSARCAIGYKQIFQ